MKVAAHVEELMFASRVKALLEQSGNEVTLVRDPSGAQDADVVVVDLMGADAAAWVATGKPALGIFNHTSPEVRDAALQAGFTLAVPRSRFVREAGELLSRIAP